MQAMKRLAAMVFVAMVAVLGCFITPSAAATNVGGPIATNTTWTPAGNPYIVTATIIVRNNVTLTINPGVEVRFNAGLGMIIGTSGNGAGTLKAIGTAAQPIKFTTNTPPGAPGQWRDIFFTDFAIDASFDGGGTYLNGCIMQHCIVEFGGGNTTNTGAVTISQSLPFLNFCEIRNNARSGIYANNSTAGMSALQIRSCNLHSNTTGGAQAGGGAFLQVNALVFSNNTVTNNSAISNVGGGLYASLNGSNATFNFSGNTISNNTSGGGIYVSMSG